MSSKHFVNGKKNADLVAEALESLAYLHPGLYVDKQHKSMYGPLTFEAPIHGSSYTPVT